MVVHRDRERPLRGVLADHVLVEELLDLPRRRNRLEERAAARGLATLLLEDVLAEVRAVGADVDLARPLDHRADFAGGLAAEGAGGHLAAAEPAVAAVSRARSSTAAAASAAKIAATRTAAPAELGRAATRGRRCERGGLGSAGGLSGHSCRVPSSPRVSAERAGSVSGVPSPPCRCIVHRRTVHGDIVNAKVKRRADRCGVRCEPHPFPVPNRRFPVPIGRRRGPTPA